MLLETVGRELPPASEAIKKTPVSLLNVLHFTSHILFPRYPHALFPLLFALRVHRLKRGTEVVLRCVPRELFQALVPAGIQGDAESCVLVAPGQLDALKASGHPWLRLAGASRGTGTLVRAVPVAGLPHSVALSTEDVCRNICSRLAVTPAESLSVVDAVAFSPCVASRIVLGLVRPTCNLENSSMDASLDVFFQRPRYLLLGDVFSVPVEKYASGHCGTDVLHFKVVELDRATDVEELHGGDGNFTTGCYVLRGRTAVVQAGDQNEFLPPRTCVFARGPGQVSGGNYEAWVLPACPPGPDRHGAELSSLLETFLSGKQPGLSAPRVRPVFMVRGSRGSGKRTAVRYAAGCLGLRLWEVDCLELQGSSPGQAEGKLRFVFTRAKQYSPCIVLLRNIHVLCHDKDGREDVRVAAYFSDELSKLYSEVAGKRGQPGTKFISVVATGGTECESASVPAAVARLFLQTVEVRGPDAGTRAAMLAWLCRTCGVCLDGEVSLDHVAAQAPGFLPADLAALVTRAVRQRVLQTAETASSEDSIALCSEDFQHALDGMHAAYSDAIGAPRIPSVRWDDIGGAAALKEEILQTVTTPLHHPHIASSGLKRSGILLYGPPGTGKTLLAKAVATECSLNFLSVKGPELLNMYVGQSERNIREVFERARAASPCVVFFDELDSLAPNRGRSGDSGGVMDRVVSQLLAEMDGLQKSSHLFVMATTNRPDLIDPALLRPGRFDKLLYVGASEDAASHLSILRALTRKFHLGSDVNLDQIAQMLPRSLTGADMYSVCSKAWMSAATRRIQALQAGSNDASSLLVDVSGSDFAAAVRDFAPSVSPEDLAYFQQLRRHAESS